MRLDAHQHFWRYSEKEYAWIGDGMHALKRDYMPEELATHMASCGIEGQRVIAWAHRILAERNELLADVDRMRGGLTVMARIGAIPTPALMPASTKVFTARSLWRGGAVPGSVLRQMSWSSVGIEKVTETSARRDASESTSTSRTIIGPRVMRWTGVRASARADRHARVSR